MKPPEKRHVLRTEPHEIYDAYTELWEICPQRPVGQIFEDSFGSMFDILCTHFEEVVQEDYIEVQL